MLQKKFYCRLTSIVWLFFTSAYAETQAINPVSYSKHNRLLNPTAYIPPQCYTKTEDANKQVSNPCYACHTQSQRPNFLNDADLQLNYSFAEDARNNPWSNLFVNRRQAIEAISDSEIMTYVRHSNYFDAQGNIILANINQDLPPEWDFNGNGRWDGFMPNAWFQFDKQGFDHTPTGEMTGWRSLAYYPFLGTFWPTNGSTDDVLIRLPQAFRTNAQGQPDKTIYTINLAILEAMFKETDIRIDPVDEASLGNIDLNKDGKISITDTVVYDWQPLKQRFMSYVGQAQQLQQAGKIKIAAGLFPVGTEFLHTVRYIDFDKAGNIKLAARLKELRYARKDFWLNYAKLRSRVDHEFKEKRDFPDRLRTVLGNHETGVSNGQGWTYAAYIENESGELRPQTYEELTFCVGCHGGIGGNRDGVFSFTRKFDHQSFQQGWSHWDQKSIKGIKDPRRQDGLHEYSYYLAQNQAGDEFRANQAVINKFFTSNGDLNTHQLARLKQDISLLLWPSIERSLELNKAYRVIVQQQGFIFGRDAIISPLDNVHKTLKEMQATGITQAIRNDMFFYIDAFK